MPRRKAPTRAVDHATLRRVLDAAFDLATSAVAKGGRAAVTENAFHVARMVKSPELIELVDAVTAFARLQPRTDAAAVQATRQIQLVIDSAQRHGEDSEPDHEVGDLQDFVRTLAAIAGPEAVNAAVHRHAEDHEVA